MLLITPQAFLTNTHGDSRSLLRISACAVTHTHSYTQLFGGRSDVHIQSEVCIQQKKHKKTLTSYRANTPPKDEHR